MRPGTLNIVDGSAAGGRITLDDTFVIGRDEAGLGRLGDDADISRRHARFSALAGGEFMVEDLGSTNGTLVNGRRIRAPHVLQPGDRVTVGRTVLQFEAPTGPAAQSTGAQSPAAASTGAASTGAQSTTVVVPGPLHAASGPGAAPDAGSHGFGTASQGGGAAPQKGPGSRRVALLLAGLLLVGAGVGIGFAADDASASTKATTASSPAIGVRDAAGHPDASHFACAADRNGNPGAGHFRFITSGCEDAHSLIAQFPLQRGTSHGQTVFFVVTDSSDKADALRRHVNVATKLANGVGTPAVQTVTVKNGVIDFPATVNFAPQRILQPAPNGFPPAKAQPSAVGDAGYSPFIRLPSGIVINAPQIANSTGHADKVLKLDKQHNTVLYQETEGRYEDKHVHYASFESGDPTAATIEDVTYAPALNTLPKAGLDGLHDSAREELVAFVNGPTGVTNPGRQGENSTILDDADPHNILKEVPVLPKHETVGDPAYTPGWDVHFAEWTPAAIAGGTRVEVQSTDEVDMWVQMKMVTGPGGMPFGPSHFTVNCPLVSIDIP